MKLEWVDVHDHQSVTPFALEHLPPALDIAFDPETRVRFGLGRDCGVIGRRFEQGVRAAVRAAPGRLARAARALDDDDHARQPIYLGRGSTNGVSSQYRFGYGAARPSAGECGKRHRAAVARQWRRAVSRRGADRPVRWVAHAFATIVA